MGTWDESSFGNDGANDWAYGLEEYDDLSLIEQTLHRVTDAGDEYLEAPDAADAIAAAEVLAWLRGRPTPVNSYTEKIAAWVAAHPLQPSAALVKKALSALDRIRGEKSELAELWAEGDDAEWVAAVDDLRARLIS